MEARDTSDQPHQITNANGFILLRVGDYETPGKHRCT